jgi:uncharacterized protein YbjT (DUF2867 family)
MYLVTGATGNVGAEVIRALAGAGQPVRALARTGRADGLPEGAQSAVGDLNDPASLRPALASVAGVFLLPGYADMPGLLGELRLAGVSRVVLLSSTAADGGELSNAVTRYMIDSEQAVRESGVPWTILRAAGLMSNALQWASQLTAGDVVRAPFASVAVAMIDPWDIAAVAALSLTAPGHEGRHYSLTGPQALLPAERVAILGSVLDRQLRFEAQPDAEARAEMSKAMPAEYVDAFIRYYADGTLDESVPLPAVQELTGRPPRAFRQWAVAHAGAFRQAAVRIDS